MATAILYDDDPKVVRVLKAYAAFRDACNESGLEELIWWARKAEDAMLDEIPVTDWIERPVTVGQKFAMTDARMGGVYEVIAIEDKQVEIRHSEATMYLSWTTDLEGPGGRRELRWSDLFADDVIYLIHPTLEVAQS